MDFASLADFHAAVRFGSFSEAARRTGTPKATMSRRIGRLEETLNVRLFERGVRALRLTDEGRRLQRRTADVLGELALIGREFIHTNGHPQGRLRVSAPGLFAQEHLGPVAARFAKLHPDVTLEIEVQDHFVDLHEDDFDVAIRVNPDPSSPLVGRRLYAQPALVVAAPSIERPVSDNAIVNAVTPLMWPAEDQWIFVADSRRFSIQPRPVVKFSSPVPLCETIIAGAGAGVLPRSVAQPHISTGALVEWGTLENRQAEVWVLHSEAKIQGVKISTFVSLLVERFAKA